MNRRFLLSAIIAFGILPFLFSSPTTSLAAAPAAIQGLHVSGNKILNAANQNVRVLGVNRSGTEYMCVHPVDTRGIFDGPADTASIQAMLTWKINAVRIPLNEDCWLGINGVDPADSGTPYQTAVVNYVNLLNTNGIIAILDLHWTAPGTTQATGQNPMPDSDHSPAFWTSVANTFKSNSSAIFDLFNEPFPDNNTDTPAAWSCWKNGGTCSGVSYPVAGMQTLVDTVRAAGATNIVMLGGIEYSNGLTQWLANKPTDSAGNIVAAWHSYNFNLCITSSCWNSQILPVIQQVPLITGEIGENDCAHTYIDPLMSFLDTNGASYLGWTWDNWAGACAGGPTLITDYNGTPTAFGIGLRDHLVSLAASGTPTTVPTTGPSVTPSTVPTTSIPPTINPNSTVQVQIRGTGPDANQNTNFAYLVKNTGTTAVSNLSVRVYFTLDGSNAASGYVLEKYYDQSGVATISAPTLASGSTYYYTVSYGTTSLAANAQWEFQTSLHLSSWATTYSSANDWFHTGYAAGALPTSYTNTNYIPAFVGSTLVWGLVPGGTATNTPTPVTPTTQVTFQPPTLTFTPVTPTATTPTSTRTNTPTNTPVTPTTIPTTPAPGGITVQIKANGPDNNQQTGFAYAVKNTGTSAVTGLSVRVYFTLDGSNAASNYTLEKYYDQSGVATVSAPTLASGSTYYYTVSYGTTSLAANAQWEFQTALHLSNWGTTFSGTNDWFHTGYAAAALPAGYTNDNYVPAFVNGSLAWGLVPGSGTAVPTLTPSLTNTLGPSPTPSNTPTASNTPTNTPSPTNGPTFTPTLTPVPGTHLANPFVGATWFKNPAWVAEVNASNVTAAQKASVVSNNTAVWLDSKDAVTGTNGYPYSITGWLDQAETQGANLIIFVVYDLPQRDCSALASNGEIPGTQAGLTDYETNYINPIAAAQGQAKYNNLRIINIVEPDSLPNLVTNTNIAACQTANGLYQAGIEYALNKLHPIANTYNYLDIGHGGWLGWSNNFTPAITLISGVIKATTAGVSSVDGFISDTANTVPVSEPYMTATQSIGGNPVNSVTFYSYNPYISEDAYDAAWATAMRGAGLPASSTNMLVDTSRNGWGGCGGGPNVSQNCRPTGPSTATDVSTFVTMSRIDRRPARGDWCNQNGAGIGARPQANPAGGVYQAYVWIKPPGESDGSSSLIPPGPDNPGGKGFDRMCDPTYGGNSLNQNSPTNALDNAPVSGRWFEAQFDQLVANAFPALP